MFAAVTYMKLLRAVWLTRDIWQRRNSRTRDISEHTPGVTERSDHLTRGNMDNSTLTCHPLSLSRHSPSSNRLPTIIPPCFRMSTISYTSVSSTRGTLAVDHFDSVPGLPGTESAALLITLPAMIMVVSITVLHCHPSGCTG